MEISVPPWRRIGAYPYLPLFTKSPTRFSIRRPSLNGCFPMPGLGEILVDNPGVLEVGRMPLLVSALAPQGRHITAVRTTQWHHQQRTELNATLQKKR